MSETKPKGVFNSWACRRLIRKLKDKKEELSLLENQLLRESFDNKTGKESRKSKKLNKKIKSIKEDMIKMAKKLIMKNGKIVEVDKDEIVLKAPEAVVVPEPTYVGPQMPSAKLDYESNHQNNDSFNNIISQNEAKENQYREEQVRAERELHNKSQAEMMRQQQVMAQQELAKREAYARQQIQQEQIARQQAMANQQAQADYLREQQLEQEYLRQQEQMYRQQPVQQVQYVIVVECVNERTFDIPVVESEVEATMNMISQAVDESSSIKLGEYSVNGRHIISWYIKQ